MTVKRQGKQSLTRWVAFFRGINVGGHNLLPMKALKADLESIDLSEVQTYIQSGNVVFSAAGKSAPTLSKAIAALVKERHRFDPWVHVLTADALENTLSQNPYKEADPGSLHYFFLAKEPQTVDFAALDSLKAPSESYSLRERVLYLHAPDGIGKSRLATRVERSLGVETTARNGRTVIKVLELARGL